LIGSQTRVSVNNRAFGKSNAILENLVSVRAEHETMAEQQQKLNISETNEPLRNINGIRVTFLNPIKV
jgi:hypothetical protein